MRNLQTESIRQQTDDQIIDATLTLLQSQSYDQLAVTEITRKAGVSRMAFYRHFGTKEKIIHTIVEQLTDDFSRDARHLPKDSRAVAQAFFEFIQANAVEIAILLNAGLREQFYPPLRDILHVLYSDILRDHAKNAATVDYISDFTASGMLAIAIRWISTGMQDSIASLSEMAKEMTDAQGTFM
ncbi:TetR/AcrR family transcriptional regulator [Weissella coleopterorum]|uniref:TetR/AcrR family transcriptional regulator n=1 Tax=Weissella coleopterorum TaxID=2714949 RepID=A0A6G8B0V0_9LACO|nr:TetR/AcrR family transcriptional regulator [Weissella coleopterorum]QIL50845.1 TetR/AcrR family transcriptional regulator [Weissella coleopterorum]